MSADVEALAALDRGVINAGMTAAEALERIEHLEARLAAVFVLMRDATGEDDEEPASPYAAAAAVQARRRAIYPVRAAQ